MQKVLNEGTEYPHKGQYKKVLKIGGEVVEVTYRKVDGIITDISNGWVK